MNITIQGQSTIKYKVQYNNMYNTKTWTLQYKDRVQYKYKVQYNNMYNTRTWTVQYTEEKQ
jgi:hypothetical protein